jgi:hypothetical protein
MSLKEAQIEYLNILSQNEVMFGSYYKVEKLSELRNTVSDPNMIGTNRGKFRASNLRNNQLKRSETINKIGPIDIDNSDDESNSKSEDLSTPDSEDDDGDMSDSFDLKKLKANQGLINGKTKEQRE